MQVERPDLSGSGKRESNTLVICRKEGNNLEKSRLIPHMLSTHIECLVKRAIALSEELMAHQVVGRVMAYQADDG